MKTPVLRVVALLYALAASVSPTQAHNLDTTATSISFAGDFTTTMSQRAALNQTLVQQNDEFWVLLKTTPGPGTNTGVGGYQTFYVPDGLQVLDAAYVFPDATDPRGFRNIPMKGQSPIAIGNGSIASASSPELVGFTLPGVNGLGFKTNPVEASGLHRGTLAGVYADTGIFFTTDPRLGFNSYGVPVPPLTGAPLAMTNNSGDTVGEYFAANIPNSALRKVLGVMTLWDSYQLRAYGRADVSPLLDSNGRGTAPWGLGNVVAGPQSGYAWEFDFNAYQNTAGTNAQKIQAAIKIGPWNRIKYPGSQIAQDQPGLVSNVLGQAGIDASLMGINPSAIPADTKAVRLAIGQLELGRPEYSAVKVRVNVAPGGGDCKIMNADAFGGDAGGTDGGKDHIWRYFDPTVVSLNPCTFLQKVVSKALVAPGETFYYDITFANTGSITLPNFTITDALPTGLTHVSATPAETTRSGQTLTWNFGTVEPGDFVTIRQYVKATGTGTLFNTATAMSGINVVGVAQTSVEVGVRAILQKNKTVTPSNTAPGGTVTYTLNIENIGTGNNGVPLRVREFLPPGFTYVSLQSATLNGASIASPTIAVDSSNATQPLFTIGQGIQPGKKLIINFTALIGAGVQPGTYFNSFQLEYEGKVIPPIPEAPVTIGGARIGDTVFRDWNGNGSQDVGELGMQNVTVTLNRDADNNGSFETLIDTRVTDASGNYLFTGLAAGSYQVSVPAAGSGGVPTGYTLTADPNGAPISSTFDVSLTANQSVLTADFGYRPAGTGTIGDQVFEDTNKNGTWNAGEPGIPNVTVRLYADNNNSGTIDAGDLLVSTTTTNGSGVYGFSSLDTTRRYLAQVDTSDSDIAAYFNGLYGSGANQLTSTNPFVVNSGFTAVTTADFGFWRALPASIGDQVFLDNNLNGTYDAGDSPLGNITVNLFAADGVTLVATTTTDVSGMYLFNSVAAGTYVVRVDPADTDIPSGFSTSVLSFNPTLAAGASFLTADFPFISVFNKSVDKASATAGELLTYTMSPYWPGPSLLSNAQVTDAIPEGTVFTSAGQGGGLSGLTGSAGVPGSHPGSPGSGSVTLTAVKDTSLDSANPTFNYGVSTSLTENRGGVNTLGTQQILAQFDLSSVPAGATLTGAQFKLTKTDATIPAINFQIYPLLKSWSEGTGNGATGQASFNLRSPGTAWTGASTAFNSLAPSADFGSLLAQTTVNGAATYTWSASALLTRVQSWYSTPATNFGLVLGCDGSGTTDTVWNSRESSGTKPELVVDYTATAIPSTTTAISVTPSSVADAGAGVNVTVSMTVTATGAVTNIIPSALTVVPGSNGATATLVSGPTGSPASIGGGGGSTVFTWVYKVFKGSAEDQVRFSGNATGTGATFASATSNGVVVKDAAVSSSVIWNLGSNSAAVNGSNPGTGGSVNSTITSSKGTYNYEDKPTLNYGADPVLAVEPDANFRCRSFIEFDLSSIPAGATITSATLRLVHSPLADSSGVTEGGDPFTVGIRRVTRAWVEGTAANVAQAGSLTWTSAGPANWTLAGGDFSATDYGSFTGGAADVSGTVYSINVLTLANEWYQGTQVNNGLALVPLTDTSGDDFWNMYGDEATNANNRPQLLVTYTPAATPATTTTMSVLPALVTDSGSGVNVTVTQTVTATGAVTNITPPTNLTVAGTNGASATKVSGPTGSGANIGAGGGSATFTWVYRVTAGTTPGQVTFAGTPTGTGATFAAATSNGIIVTPPLTMTATVKTPPGVNLVNNIAKFFNGPTLLAEDNAITSVTGSIGDYVWADTDADGVQDSGEFGIPGVTVRLFAADGVTLLASATTDSSGLYRFYGLAAGNYVVRYDDTTTPANYFGSTPASVSVSLAASQQFNNADFGLAPIPPGTGSIGDYVWIDADNDGVQDVGELPLQGVVVTLQRQINGNWTTIGTATTGSDGLYNFTNLTAGSYRVTVDAASQITSPYAQGSFNLGSVMAPTFDRDGTVTPHVALVTLATNSTVVTNADFGYNWSGSIGDKVWWDYDTDGLQDETPLVGVPNARVQLYFDKDFDGVFDRILGDYEILRVFTDASGNYLISNLPPGNYFVDVYEDSITTGGVRNVVPTTADIVPVNLIPSSMNVSTADFGYYEGARAEATIFWDVNHNGIRDGGEPLLSGLTVTLTGTDLLGNTVTKTAVTDTNGNVVFLMPEGNYTISYNLAQVSGSYPGLGTATTPTSFEFAGVAGDDGIKRFDFGVDNTGAIGDTIYADTNGNGSQGAGEPGLAGVTVNLYFDANGDGTIDYGAGDLLLETALTDSTGKYNFVGLADTTGAQRYMVEAVTSTLPSGYLTVPTGFPAGTVTATSRYSTALTGGQVISIVDFGYPLVPATYRSISGTIYNDNGTGGGTASDGTKQVNEPGIPSVTVTVQVDTNADGTFDQTFTIPTDSNGFYSLGGILQGSNVRVTVNTATLPSTAFIQTGDPNGAPLSNIFNITNLQVNTNNLNFGYVESLGSIGGTVVKGNGNGIAESGEPAVASVPVTLTYSGVDGILGTSDDLVFNTTTNASGDYSFTGLRPGPYQITTGIPSAYKEYADADSGNSNNIILFLPLGADIVDRDFEYQAGSISGFLWTDTDADGLREIGEPFLQNIAVFLDFDGNGNLDPGEPSTTTSVGGFYQFTGLASGTYPVRVVSAGLPSGSIPSYDIDGIPTAHVGVVTLTPNEDRSLVDFGYFQNGSVTGTVLADTDNNNSGDIGISGVALQLRDATTNALISSTTTDGSGAYSFNDVPPGTYKVVETQPTGYASVSDRDGGDLDIIGDVTVVTVTSGTTNSGNNFVEEQYADLQIVKTVDNATPLVGSRVTFTLDATNNGPSAATGVAVTDILPDGYTFVSANPPADYNSGTGVWTIGAMANGATNALTITATVKSTGTYLNVATIDGDQPDPDPSNDTDNATTTPIQLGAITGAVLEDTDNNGTGDTAIQGVILSLVDGSGSPVLDGNGQPRTATSDSNGSYSFGSLPPGTYGVVETQPGGFASLSDKDGGNLDEIRPITVTAGQTNIENDFVEISSCPDTWADWKQLHPTETAAGNPDADAYDNFAEFAFAMPYNNGSGSPWLGSTAWVIRPSTNINGALEGVFIRPKGAPLNVTYTLQYAATLGNPTVWQSVVIATGGVGTNASAVDNGDCTETITILDLETITGLTGGKGVVRIQADLDEVPPTGTDHTSYTETEGWTETGLEICCRTYNNPYLRETAFTGTISAVSGQNLTFALSGAGGLDLANLLSPGVSYFIEVTSGDNEGHRFDVVSATGNSLALVSDSNIHSAAAPFNTLAGAPPVNLAGDTVALRRHWTLNEVFPPTGFVATGSQSSADQVQIFAGGAWTIYWLYDVSTSDSIPARWVDAADGGMLDKGATVIPSGQGVFFNNRNAVTSILSYGEIRENRFVRPLAIGSNLLGGGYPLNQSPNGNLANNPLDFGRAMNLSTGFFGSRDFKTADSIFVWKADTTITGQGFDSYFFLNGAPTLPSLLRWVKVGDASLAPVGATPFLLGNRSAFVRTNSEVPQYTVPFPWKP